jgi:hypothetical protein
MAVQTISFFEVSKTRGCSKNTSLESSAFLAGLSACGARSSGSLITRLVGSRRGSREICCIFVKKCRSGIGVAFSDDLD